MIHKNVILQHIKAYEDISAGNLFDIGCFDSGYACVHVFVHCLQLASILFEFHELFLEGIQIVHGISKRINHRSA